MTMPAIATQIWDMKYRLKADPRAAACPSCGSPDLHLAEGCKSCVCGWSKCQ